MKSALPRLILVSATSVLSAAAACAQPVLPTDVLARASALAGEAAQSLAPAGARVSVHPGKLDSRLQLAPCDDIQTYLPAGLSPWGRTRVGLRCLRGPARWNVMLPVTVQAWAPAVVLSAPLPAGARLQASQLGSTEVDWASAAPGSLFADVAELTDRVLVRPLPAGRPISTTDLQVRQWFAVGDSVQVHAQGRGFSIVTEALALTPGLEGRPARVRTAAGRVLQAMPVGAGRVQVAL